MKPTSTKIMNKHDAYKQVKDLSWKLFCQTGEIKYYGAYRSAKELDAKLLEEESQAGMQM
jgi:hypothetical protein